MERPWTDPRDGKEWRVHFTWTGPVAQGVRRDFRPSGPLEPSDPVAVFYHPADTDMTRESLRTDRKGDEDLDSMTDQELMDLLDEAKP